MKFNKQFCVVLLLAIIIMPSCTEKTHTSKPNSRGNYGQVDPMISTSYPSDKKNPETFYYPAPELLPTGDSLHPEKLAIPTPSVVTGVINGRILIKGTNEPYLNSLLLLGEISKPDKEGYPPLIGYSLESNPRGTQSTNGDFYFSNIMPGEYGIVLWSPMSTFLLSNFETGETILITVTAGEITDLGAVYIK